MLAGCSRVLTVARLPAVVLMWSRFRPGSRGFQGAPTTGPPSDGKPRRVFQYSVSSAVLAMPDLSVICRCRRTWCVGSCLCISPIRGLRKLSIMAKKIKVEPASNPTQKFPLRRSCRRWEIPHTRQHLDRETGCHINSAEYPVSLLGRVCALVRKQGHVRPHFHFFPSSWPAYLKLAPRFCKAEQRPSRRFVELFLWVPVSISLVFANLEICVMPLIDQVREGVQGGAVVPGAHHQQERAAEARD